jgi:hypothetical protein
VSLIRVWSHWVTGATRRYMRVSHHFVRPPLSSCACAPVHLPSCATPATRTYRIMSAAGVAGGAGTDGNAAVGAWTLWVKGSAQYNSVVVAPSTTVEALAQELRRTRQWACRLENIRIHLVDWPDADSAPSSAAEDHARARGSPLPRHTLGKAGIQDGAWLLASGEAVSGPPVSAGGADVAAGGTASTFLVAR